MTPLAFYTLSNGRIVIVTATGYVEFSTFAQARAWAEELSTLCALVEWLQEMSR